MTQILVSAAHKSSGKTTVSIGLCAAYRARGFQVQPFKKGPDYIDPLWLGKAAGRPCFNLDFYTASESEILAEFGARSAAADLVITEGNKGLYDGLDLTGENSNAALAKALRAPVVLVLDVRGTIRGVAPLIIGYQIFDPQVRIAGVILNQVGGSRHEAKLRAVIEHYTDVPVLGAVRRDATVQMVERHLGLMPSNESPQALQKIATIGQAISEQVDLEALYDIAAGFPLPRIEAPASADRSPGSATVRIGIARDEAFGFYYPGDLERLQQAGAELVWINTLRDGSLPPVDGVFLGGGFPETAMRDLEANVALRHALREAINRGLPAYAECGGLMYLTRSLRWNGRVSRMVGVIPADCEMHDQPQGRGYVRLEPNDDHPWKDFGSDAPPAEDVAAHEFHYSTLTNVAPDLKYAYRVKRGFGIDGKVDGIVYRNLLASYTHLRDTNRYHWTRNFLAFVRARTSARTAWRAMGNTGD